MNYYDLFLAWLILMIYGIEETVIVLHFVYYISCITFGESKDFVKSRLVVLGCCKSFVGLHLL